MKTKHTPEHLAKMQEARIKARQGLDSQTITIDKDWRIIRPDELNWELQYKYKTKGYYSTIVNALSALPAKMLNEAARGTLDELLKIHREIIRKIENAVSNVN